MFFGKLIGGVLGFVLLGLLGAVVGVIAGHYFDRGLAQNFSFSDPAYLERMRRVFFETCFLLLGHLAKADGRISEEEVAHTEEIMRHLGVTDDLRQEAIGYFKQGADPAFDLEATMSAFNDMARGQRPLQHTLLVFLISLALADGSVHRDEDAALEKIAAYLGYAAGEYEKLLRMMEAQAHFQGAGSDKAVGMDQIADAYMALGVDPGCSDRDLKRAYRKLMSENHPDKLIAQGVPEHMIKLATERSQEIQAAYELVRRARKGDARA